jgi:protein O-GlcNAc transferase
LHHAKPFYPTQIRFNGAVNKRLRVGFLSPDFRNHSVARFMTVLLRHWNPTEDGCEVVCYSDVKEKAEASLRLEALGEATWVYCYRLSDGNLAERIRRDGIDVLIDLAGHTGNHRLKVFARKPAPLQISWLGYPNTTGLETIDYRLTDAIADPVGVSDELSTEKLVRLTGGFHCFEPPVTLPEVGDAPVMRTGYPTFGSFNNQSKVNELTLSWWAEVLRALPDARMVLKNRQLGDVRNREIWLALFDEFGVAAERIELLGFMEGLGNHYETYQRVDIALDTFPYNGTTTTCEALWMGVPVLTFLGKSQRGRTGASLLTHAGLSDWVARDRDDFVAKAVEWSHRPVELNRLRQGLRQQVTASTIGDGVAFTRKFFATCHRLWVGDRADA